MNSDDEKFEQVLRALKPSAPSPDLMARLRNTLPVAKAHAPKLVVRRANILELVVPLAAAATVIIGLAIYFTASLRNAPPSQIVSAAKPEISGRPVQTTDCVLGAREIGIVRAPNGRPYRVVQGIGIGQQVWEDDSGKRSTRTFPQQQVLLVSMNSI